MSDLLVELWPVAVTYVLPVLGAVAAGALIGLERELLGHPAGLRTHTLVSLSSALLMLAAVHQTHWVADTPAEMIRIDPVRMAHGILTGIGFLCGGVIFRQGLSVHGLTTAASLWMVSALGTLYGVGFYGLAIGGTIATLLVLTALRGLEPRLPRVRALDLKVRYRRDGAPTEGAFRATLQAMTLACGSISRRLVDGGQTVELAATARGPRHVSASDLAARLDADPAVTEYDIEPRKN